jgi:hypothetical protein
MKLLKQCSLDGVTRRKDKSLKISFITSLEQSSTELMEVDKLLDSNGILYYKEGETVSTEEILAIDKTNLEQPKILAIDKTNLEQPKKRTQSQETKIMLWRCWKELTEEGKYSKSQEVFYNAMHTWFRQQLEDRYLKK